jgi:hypothetical protein
VWQRIKLRWLPATKPDELENSRNKALDLLFEDHDPNQFPKYRNAQGQAMGGPEQWANFDRQLAKMTPRQKREPAGRQLIDAKDRALAYQHKYLASSPDYQEYQRWFGIGRNWTEAQWAKYQSGGSPHYSDTKDPVENANRDEITQQYKTLTPVERRTTHVAITVNGKQENMSALAAMRHITATLDRGWEKDLGLDTTGTGTVP